MDEIARKVHKNKKWLNLSIHIETGEIYIEGERVWDENLEGFLRHDIYKIYPISQNGKVIKAYNKVEG